MRKCDIAYSSKAEFAEEGTFFVNRFPSLRTFVKKVGNQKTEQIYITRN